MSTYASKKLTEGIQDRLAIIIRFNAGTRDLRACWEYEITNDGETVASGREDSREEAQGKANHDFDSYVESQYDLAMSACASRRAAVEDDADAVADQHLRGGM